MNKKSFIIIIGTLLALLPDIDTKPLFFVSELFFNNKRIVQFYHVFIQTKKG